MGQVVSVVKEDRMTHKGSVYTVYFATVKPTDSSIFSTPELRSDESGYAYEKGEYVKIKYDPSDHSKYFIEHASPSEGPLNLIITGAVLSVFGVIFLFVHKSLKSR